MKRSHGLLAALAITLSLTACGASEGAGPTEPTTPEANTSETEAPQLYPSGPFELTTANGAEITFELPTPATNESLAEIEQFRTDAGGAAVSYLLIKVDNRNGTEPVTLETVSAFDAEGTKYEFTEVTSFVDEWSPYYSEDYEYVLPDGSKLPEEEGDALYNRGIDIYNANIGEIAVAESGTIVLASSQVELPGEFTRVAVFPDAFATEGEDATPPGSKTSE